MFASLRESRWRFPALLLLFTVFFYWKILFTYRYMFPWDGPDFFYPFWGYVHEELRHLRFPLWNPFSMSGSPIIADPEAQIFYPLNWLLVVLHPFSPLTFKWVEAMEIAHFFLAGLFMFWLARDFTKDAFAALLGGVLFMSSGAMVAHTEHVASVEAMAWYPLVFLLARRGLLHREWYWTVSAGFFLGIENLVGHWQHAVYLGLLLFLYFAYEACAGPLRKHLWPHWIIHLVAIGAIGAGLAMVQVIPAAGLSAHSIRAQLTYWGITQGNNPRYLWTLFLPNYFGGMNGVPYLESVEPSFNYVFLTVPACLLALVGLIEMARRRNYFWLGLIGLTVELSIGRNGHLAELVYRIPVLNLFRTMTAFFDLGNFALCLMAAFGMHALISRDTRGSYHRWLSYGLLALLLFGAAWGLIHQLAWKIPGWYHMLAVLALFSLLIALWQRGQIAPKVAHWAILFLMVFELCQYSMNQIFNWSINNPRTETAYDYAAHRKETLEFLRSDGGGDFRVAAIDGSPWGSNGSNVWRIPAILGWNPVMLQNYREYIRQFIDAENYALPWGETEHKLDSPLLDLLGVKYILVVGPDEERLRLADIPGFEKTFAESDWRSIYRNKDYFSRAWFYPRAYALPSADSVLPLMKAHWFEPRRTLLLAQPDLPAGLLPNSEPLVVIEIAPGQFSGLPEGTLKTDENCAAARRFFGDWGATDNSIRTDAVVIDRPGPYALLIEYADPYSTPPLIATSIEPVEPNTDSPTAVPPSVLLPPVLLPMTSGWSCTQTRTAELGTARLDRGRFRLTLKSRQTTPIDLYSLRLVRLPEDVAVAGTSGPVATPSSNLLGNRIGVIPSVSDRSAIAHASAFAQRPERSRMGGPERESKEESAFSSSNADFSFHDFSVTANQYAFRADLPQDGFVLVNEIYYPGWEATVDGQPAKILRANHIFRALAVPAGSHQIEMRFRSRNFWLGASVSLLTLAGLLCYFALHRRREP